MCGIRTETSDSGVKLFRDVERDIGRRWDQELSRERTPLGLPLKASPHTRPN